jgi:hypothetical protein
MIVMYKNSVKRKGIRKAENTGGVELNETKRDRRSS